MDNDANRASVNPRGVDCESCTPTKWWTVWKWIERGLFASGLGLLAIYGAIRLDNSLSSTAALENFVAVESSPPSAPTSYEGNDSPQEAGLNGSGGSRVDGNKQSPVNQPGTAIAVLQIPRIHLAVPVLDGTDKRALSHGVGRIAGTARPGEHGNIGIAGHRDSYFRGLKDVRLGDVIELKTKEGADIYVVDQIKVVTPNDVSVLRPRPMSSLTLVTCYPFYFVGRAPQRYIVMASLTDETSSGSGNSTPGSEPTTNTTNKEKQ
jgi:sortase A